MPTRTRRSILPVILLGLGLGGGLWIWFFQTAGAGQDMDAILAKAHESLGSGVYELQLDFEASQTLIPNRVKTAASRVLPHQELIVGPNECFHYEIDLEGIFGDHPISFHLGYDGEQIWSYCTGDEEVSFHQSIDGAATLDPLSPLAIAALKRALGGWTNTRELLMESAKESGRTPLTLVDQVSRSPNSDEQYWRLETKNSRGGDRLCLWVTPAGRLDRIDCGALSFRVTARDDLSVADFEIGNWVADYAQESPK